MSRYDYSKEHAEGYLWALKEGQPISDEMFWKACSYIRPVPLPPHLMDKLLDILDENRRLPKGRPTTEILNTRMELVANIEILPEDQMNPSLRTELIARLKSGKRYYEYERWLLSHRKRNKWDRDTMIRIFYKLSYEGLKKSSPPILEQIGEVDDSWIDKSLPLRERAIQLTMMLLKKYTRYSPPSAEAMRNLVGKRSQKM